MDTQFELFKTTKELAFEKWVHTTAGGHAMNIFIREARRMKHKGFQKFGAKMLIERIRWLNTLAQGPENEEDSYKINNNHTPYMARFAMERDETLKDFFRCRAVGQKQQPRRAVIIPIIEKTA